MCKPKYMVCMPWGACKVCCAQRVWDRLCRYWLHHVFARLLDVLGPTWQVYTCKLCVNVVQTVNSKQCKLCVNFLVLIGVNFDQTVCKLPMMMMVLLQKFWGMQSFKAPEMTSRLRPLLLIDKFTALAWMISTMRKQCVNRILTCANQNQQSVNFFSPHANPEISWNPKWFAKPCWTGAYVDVLFMGHTFRVQSGKVTFWGQKKFTQVCTVYMTLPPDESVRDQAELSFLQTFA
jgi:hypothetical protein